MDRQVQSMGLLILLKTNEGENTPGKGFSKSLDKQLQMDLKAQALTSLQFS